MSLVEPEEQNAEGEDNGDRSRDESTDVEKQLRVKAEGRIHDATDMTERNETYHQALINGIKEDKHKDRNGDLARQMGAKF